MKITIETLENASPGEIIASGFFENSPDEVYLTDHPKAGKNIKWVAVRWGIPDWCIYYEWLFQNDYDKKYANDGKWHWPENYIARQWSKLPTSYCKKIPWLELDDEVLKKYRD